MNMVRPAQDLLALARTVAEGCTECRACQFRCAFLNAAGTPALLARHVLDQPAAAPSLLPAFQCSLCGLCRAICPLGLPLPDFFLAMRATAVRHNLVDLRPYRPLLAYERIGRSRLLADRILPDRCGTVLFPGCTFAGTRPDTLLALFRHLRTSLPDLGLVLDCCSKPSHDLGRHDAFAASFAALANDLRQRGIRRILTVCPNCHGLLARHCQDMAIQSAASVLATLPRPHHRRAHGHGVQHIPCPVRGDSHEIRAVRTLAEMAGLTLAPLKHQGRLCPCCGEGGATGLVRPDLANTWGEHCGRRAGAQLLLTSCAGCVNRLGSHATAIHILDLYFFPRRTMAGLQPAHGWRTYLHRLLLRIRLRRILSAD